MKSSYNFQNSLAALNFYEEHFVQRIQRVGGDHEMFKYAGRISSGQIYNERLI